MKIIYICKWDKIKSRSWSGTTFSLLNALEKNNEIYNYEIKYSFLEKIISKLCKLKISFNGIDKSNQFPKYIDLINQKKLYKLVENKNEIVLQIGCFGHLKNSCVYEDLSAEALLWLFENKIDSFKYSNFRNSNIKSIKDKATRQNECYEQNKIIFCMSNWVAEILKQKIKNPKIICVGGGINLNPNLVDFSKKRNNKFLFVGRDFYRKGGDIVVKAFEVLLHDNPNLELYIAGPENKLMETNENVKWLGDLNNIELYNYFNMCDVFCMPSRFEAYGIVFSEALCFGLPCIGRNICEMPYFISNGENGYLLEDDNIIEMAALMKKALSNIEMRNYMYKNHDKYIQYYSWDAVANRITKAIKETINFK